MAEMRNSAIKMKSQTLLKSITKTEFVGEVTEASRSIPVVAFLYKAEYANANWTITTVVLKFRSLPACRLMEQYLLDLASKYSGRTKFVKIIGNECIPGYPDRNLPTLLIYINGDLRVQQVGIERLGGMAMQQSGKCSYFTISFIFLSPFSLDLERFLIKVGAVPRQNQDEDDSDLGSESDESD